MKHPPTFPRWSKMSCGSLCQVSCRPLAQFTQNETSKMGVGVPRVFCLTLEKHWGGSCAAYPWKSPDLAIPNETQRVAASSLWATWIAGLQPLSSLNVEYPGGRCPRSLEKKELAKTVLKLLSCERGAGPPGSYGPWSTHLCLASTGGSSVERLHTHSKSSAIQVGMTIPHCQDFGA